MHFYFIFWEDNNERPQKQNAMGAVCYLKTPENLRQRLAQVPKHGTFTCFPDNKVLFWL